MDAEKSSNKKAWVLFTISTLVTIAMLIYLPQWFWLSLPFTLTYLVEAMDVM